MLYLLIAIENDLQISLAEDDLASEEPMGFVACDSLEPVQDFLVYELGAEFLDQLLVVNRLDLSIFANFARDVPRIDGLFGRRGVRGVGSWDSAVGASG